MQDQAGGEAGQETSRKSQPASARGISEDGVMVTFSKKKKTALWKNASDGSLLEFAEAQGLRLPYGCRGGVCGRCSMKVKGEVTYVDEVFTDVDDGHALLCVAMPKKLPCNTSSGKGGGKVGGGVGRCQGCEKAEKGGSCEYATLVIDF
jgi:ferredoxin